MRSHLVVLQGALNSIRVFLPAMPPSTVSGNVTSAQMTRMITIVPKGRAAVLCSHPTRKMSTICPAECTHDFPAQVQFRINTAYDAPTARLACKTVHQMCSESGCQMMLQRTR